MGQKEPVPIRLGQYLLKVIDEMKEVINSRTLAK